MARTNCYKNIWSSSTSLLITRNQSNFEEIDVCALVNTGTDDHTNMSDTQDPINEKSINTENESNKCASEIIEDHKQLLIKAVAQMLNQKKPEDEIWEEIENKTGYDHRAAWKDMRDIAMKKLEYLLPANDLLENIPTNQHLIATEWLLFDLVLVHEKLNVVKIAGPSNGSEHEPQCLKDLFKLVTDFCIEELAGHDLKEAWKELTVTYNARGRQCSSMMLQLRWYQLKQLTRDCFYSPQSSRSFEECRGNKPTLLKTSIVMKFPNIIMQQLYPSWETLIQKKCVILFEDFETAGSFCRSEVNTNLSESSNTPPVVEINDNIVEDAAQVTSLSDALCKSIAGYTNALHHTSKEMDTESTHETLSTSTEESSNALPNTYELKIINHEEQEFKDHFLNDVIRIIQKKRLKMSTVCSILSNMTGRDCEKFWTQMRENILLKVDALQAANDFPDQVAPEMRLTAAEWLIFDLCLVHEEIDVCSHNKAGYTCLSDLFLLVLEYKLKHVTRRNLAEVWINITLHYNKCGRECSPMLLQLRWYQMKKLTRDSLFNNSVSIILKTRKLLKVVAVEFRKFLTNRLRTWRELVLTKNVVSPKDFVMAIKRISKWKGLNAEVGWYLHKKDSLSNSKSMSNVGQIKVIELDNDDDRCLIRIPKKAYCCKNMFKRKSDTNSSDKLQTAPEIIIEICDSDDDETNKISPQNFNTIHNQNITTGNATKKRKYDEDEQNEVNFDSNIVFLDDGIEFEDGNKHKTEDVESKTDGSHRKKSTEKKSEHP